MPQSGPPRYLAEHAVARWLSLLGAAGSSVVCAVLAWRAPTARRRFALAVLAAWTASNAIGLWWLARTAERGAAVDRDDG